MASTNTLTGLIPSIYAARDVVSRSMAGATLASTIDASAQGAALNQTITVPIAPDAVAEDIVPSNVSPDSGGAVIGSVDMSITKNRMSPVAWNGDEELGLGEKIDPIMRDRFAQAMQTLAAEVEVDLCTEIYKNASRAYGTAGTTPFASDLSDVAQLKKILDDNGAPGQNGAPGIRSMVINSAAGVNYRTLTQLTNVNESGTASTLRQGTLESIFGFDLKESAGIQDHTKGTGTGYLVNGAEAIGQTDITLDTGTVGGTGIIAGDIVTFAADTANKYVVNTGLAAVSGDITIGGPGLRVAIPDNNAMTIGNDFTANLAFARSAVMLLARTPAIPSAGDMASDRMQVTDPVSGLVFTISMYKQYQQVHFEVSLAWGVRCIKPAHTAVLLG